MLLDYKRDAAPMDANFSVIDMSPLTFDHANQLVRLSASPSLFSLSVGRDLVRRLPTYLTSPISLLLHHSSQDSTRELSSPNRNPNRWLKNPIGQSSASSDVECEIPSALLALPLLPLLPLSPCILFPPFARVAFLELTIQTSFLLSPRLCRTLVFITVKKL